MIYILTIYKLEKIKYSLTMHEVYINKFNLDQLKITSNSLII